MSDRLPSKDELNTIWTLAARIAKSNVCPVAYKGKPEDTAVAVLWGRELGLGPMASIQYIDVVMGTPALNAEGSAALTRKAGHSIGGSVVDGVATAKGKRKDTGDEMTVTFSIADATKAGLVNRSEVWKKYPDAMLWNRAVKQLCRQLFSDVTMGMAHPEEEIAPIEETHDYDTGEVIEIKEKSKFDNALDKWVVNKDLPSGSAIIINDAELSEDEKTLSVQGANAPLRAVASQIQVVIPRPSDETKEQYDEIVEHGIEVPIQTIADAEDMQLLKARIQQLSKAQAAKFDKEWEKQKMPSLVSKNFLAIDVDAAYEIIDDIENPQASPPPTDGLFQ